MGLPMPQIIFISEPVLLHGTSLTMPPVPNLMIEAQAPAAYAHGSNQEPITGAIDMQLDVAEGVEERSIEELLFSIDGIEAQAQIQPQPAAAVVVLHGNGDLPTDVNMDAPVQLEIEQLPEEVQKQRKQ